MRRRSACASTPATCSRPNINNAIIIARHGSWNRTKKVGGDVVVVKLNRDGTVQVDRAVHHRLHSGQQICGPPGRRLVLKDGSLLVSDDYNGAVYRVTYGNGRVSAR